MNSSMDILGFKCKANALQQNACLYIQQVIAMDFEQTHQSQWTQPNGEFINPLNED